MQATTYNRVVTACLILGVGSSLAYESSGEFKWIAACAAALAALIAAVTYLTHHLKAPVAEEELVRALPPADARKKDADILASRFIDALSHVTHSPQPKYVYSILSRPGAHLLDPSDRAALVLRKGSVYTQESTLHSNPLLIDSVLFDRSCYKRKHLLSNADDYPARWSSGDKKRVVVLQLTGQTPILPNSLPAKPSMSTNLDWCDYWDGARI